MATSSNQQSSGSSIGGSTPQEIISNYTSYLPSYLQSNLGQVGAYGNALSNTALSGVTGAGGATAGGVQQLSNNLNPSLGTASTAAQGASDAAGMAAQGAENQLGAINLTGLSPGESAATERSLASNNVGTGNLGLLNPTNTIANAMNFGGAFNSKLPLYNTAVNTASGSSGAFSNASNAASGAANANSGSNSTFNSIANPSAGALSGALGNTGLLNQVSQGNFSGSQNQGSGSSWGVANSCCFIFMEAYRGQMPVSVRKFRDRYYRLRPDIATGYKRMAKWLVPLMQRYSIVRGLVWHCMIKPATRHTEHPVCNWNKAISRFWLRAWAVYGKA